MNITGTTNLVPDGDQSIYTVNLNVTVNVPLIGGKLAEFSKKIALENLAKEFAIGDSWLASH